MLILLMGSDSCHTTTCQWRPCFVLISATPAGYRHFDLRSRWSRSLRLHNFHYPSAAHAAYTKDCAAGLGWQYDTNIDPAYDGTYWSQLYGQALQTPTCSARFKQLRKDGSYPLVWYIRWNMRPFQHPGPCQAGQAVIHSIGQLNSTDMRVRQCDRREL